MGEALVADPGVDMVSVTGSTATGRAVMRGATGSLKRVHLELGGKAPALVFGDADLAEMARGVAMGATYNTGQDCTAATRVYISRDVYDEAVQALDATLAQITVGDPWDPATDIGPLISAAHRDRVHGFVERSAAAGASVLHGGIPLEGPGFYFPPTLVSGAAQDSEIVQDESSDRSSWRCPSTARTRRYGWPTTPPTAWPPRSGPGTWRGPCASRTGSTWA